MSIAAMESTSTYWKPPFYCLEEVMDVVAAERRAHEGRARPARVTSGTRSGSHSCWSTGQSRLSFVPPPDIRRLRMLTRYREQLMGDRTRELVRLELMLEDASIKLSSVVSSLKTISARAMLTAMIDGEQDPLVLADMAKGKLRRKIPSWHRP